MTIAFLTGVIFGFVWMVLLLVLLGLVVTLVEYDKGYRRNSESEEEFEKRQKEC